MEKKKKTDEIEKIYGGCLDEETSDKYSLDFHEKEYKDTIVKLAILGKLIKTKRQNIKKNNNKMKELRKEYNIDHQAMINSRNKEINELIDIDFNLDDIMPEKKQNVKSFVMLPPSSDTDVCDGDVFDQYPNYPNKIPCFIILPPPSSLKKGTNKKKETPIKSIINKVFY